MSAPIHVMIPLPLDKSLIKKIKDISKNLSIHSYPSPKTEEIPKEEWADAEVLFTYKVFPEPEEAPNLKWIQYYAAGADRIIDLPICQNPDIVLTTLSGGNASQVAEHALTMLLALGHKLPEHLARQADTEWIENKIKEYQPVELRYSTVGIVGYGSIGRQIARLLNGFGATVLASKRDVMTPEDKGYIPGGLGDPQGDYFRRLYPPEALSSMFQECDYVIVTTPLTQKTQSLVGEALLASLKPSAYLIDVSRGGIVDHSALTEALSEGKLAGAALDVFPEEPLPEESPLWGMSNVILTPHVAGISPNYHQQAVDLFSENLTRYVDGQPLLNQVDLNEGY